MRFIYSMYIAPVSNNKYNYSFQANRRLINDEAGKLLYRTTTYFFRQDFNWKSFSKFIESFYKDAEKVNVFCHACSNGMEPYSFVIELLERSPSSAKKFFPIIAKDLDYKNIEVAKKGIIDIDLADLYGIKEHTKGFYSPYLTAVPSNNPNYFMAVKPTENLKSKVHFEQGDIIDDIEKMPKSNTILFCRNFWPYLEPNKQELLAQKLENHFDDTSLIVIGDFDEKYFIDHILRKHEFGEFIMMPRVYRKVR